MKKILFVTGTRADYGKMKSIIDRLEHSSRNDVFIFATGMHLLCEHGNSIKEILKDGYSNLFTYINQSYNTPSEQILANTIYGLSYYVRKVQPDLLVVHGDRIEALAGAVVASLNNIILAHIEGGEVSGSIDEHIRHAVSKLAHVHFVSNEEAKKRLIQMGEEINRIYVVGSADIDIMLSQSLPSLDWVKRRVDINFDKYAICIYHPVTSELDKLKKNIVEVIKGLIISEKKYVIILPNNDAGAEIIINELEKLNNLDNFKIYPNIPFEEFIVLLKNCEFIIGNSSAGIREAEVFHKVAINVGSRQNGRSHSRNIINVVECSREIVDAIRKVKDVKTQNAFSFGEGNTAEKISDIIDSEEFWNTSIQKKFVDIH